MLKTLRFTKIQLSLQQDTLFLAFLKHISQDSCSLMSLPGVPTTQSLLHSHPAHDKATTPQRNSSSVCSEVLNENSTLLPAHSHSHPHQESVQELQESLPAPHGCFTSASRLGFLFLHDSCSEAPFWPFLHLDLLCTFSTSILPLVGPIVKPKIKPVSSLSGAAAVALTVLWVLFC